MQKNCFVLLMGLLENTSDVPAAAATLNVLCTGLRLSCSVVPQKAFQTNKVLLFCVVTAGAPLWAFIDTE
jgi:hypothetical protein